MKHYHMCIAQFKKRTTHLDIPGNFKDLYQHVVPILNSVKPRPERSRVSGLRAEEFGDLIFLDHGWAKIGDKTHGFLIVLDGATSHLTALSMHDLNEWMVTFQMKSKAICADMAFHKTSRHAGILSNAQCEENSDRTAHTMAKPSGDGCTIVQEISLGTRGYSLQKPGPDHFGTNHSCPVDAQGSNGEKYTRDLKVVTRPRNWPCDENQEISWTQLP